MPKPGFQFTPEGATLSVFSHGAEKITLCLFENGRERQVPLLRGGDYHTVFLPGWKPGFSYGLRADGHWVPEQGLSFDPLKVLLDPYATEIEHSFSYDDRLYLRGADTSQIVPKAIARAPLPDLPLRKLKEPDFIYELQVRAFTKLHPDVPEAQRGTVAALAHPSVIAHLKKIGVDTIELMPITAWLDEPHLAKLGLRNAWGYNPVSFFAPDPRLAPGGLAEIRAAVAELHRHGFNVLLDVVYNHSGEGGPGGATVSFRGLDDAAYYARYQGQLANDSGCGNTLALNRAPMMNLALDSLRHWVLQAGIDGFRFDLATTLGRVDHGFEKNAPLFAAIEADPVLASRIMIAEPWDVGAGGYQLGQFPPRWYEWNDKFRDDARRFWRGDDFSANAMATRLAGSQDIFGAKGAASKSVNFIAAHDGFTLHDLTIYQQKDNFANGENNRDGNGGEITCVGANPAALIGSVLASRGVAMITAGDEFGRTQKGNNNAYAQDNELTWLNWADADQELIAITAAFAKARRAKKIGVGFLDPTRAKWLGDAGLPIDWAQPHHCVLTLDDGKAARITLDEQASKVSIK